MHAPLKRYSWIATALGAALLSGCAGGGTPAWTLQPVLHSQDSPGQQPASYYALGRYRQQHNDADGAAQAYRQAIALAPQQLDARNALAVLAAQQGRLDQAGAMLRQLCLDFPDQAQPLNNLGYVDYLRGDYAAAQRSLRQALRLDAGQPHVAANLALAESALRASTSAAAMRHAPEDATMAAASAPEQTAALAAASTPAPLATTTPARAVAPGGMALLASTPAAQPGDATVTRAAPSRLELVQLAEHEFRLQPRAGLAGTGNVVAAWRSGGAPAATDSAVAPQPMPAAAPPQGYALQIVNGNGGRGVGLRLQHVLSGYGIASGRMLEQRRHYQRRTIIEYLPGQQNQARALLAALHGHATLVAARSLPDGSALRLVLGHDLLPYLTQLDHAVRPAHTPSNLAAG